MVRAVGETVLLTGVIKSVLGGEPVFRFEALGDDRAVGAVEVVLEIGIGLQLAEVAEKVLEPPFGVAEGRPGVVVLGDSPEEHLAVDGAGAAGDLAPWDHNLRGFIGALADELRWS